jgi:predicted phosphodiesterase
MTIKIQYVSDIHLETYSNTETTNKFFEKILKPSANILALCGDIGYPETPLYEPFLLYCSINFEHIFYVAGNHEYYNKYRAASPQTVEDRTVAIKHTCSKFPNIHFLDKEVFQLPNLTIVGCTLWSKLDMPTFMLERFNDFHMIYETSTAQLTPATYMAWNKEHIEFLEQTLSQENKSDNPILVITHHCPTYEIIIDKYQTDPYNMNSVFANKDLVSKLGKNVKVWLCGHTHGCKTININGTIIATNTGGYKSEYIQGFKSDAVIELLQG